MEKYTNLFEQLNQAVLRLDEVLRMPVTSVVRDSAIQRFEFCMDLAWKTLKTYLLERKGVVVNSPKDAFRQAFAQQLIGHEEQWIAFVDMRNETVHTYNEKTAEDIYKDLPAVLEHLKTLLASLKK